MVISYTQNLYFKIQCTKSENKIIFISFFIYFKEFTQQFEYENHCRSLYFSCLLKTSINIRKTIPCSIEMKSNNKIKFVVYKNISCSFCYKVPTSISLPQNYVSKNGYPFPRTPIFGQSPSHYQHDSKLDNNSNFKPPMSND
jgi:hypothetical protein